MVRALRASLVSRLFLVVLFVSVFWVVCVGAEVVVVDWTEEDVYIGRMSWGNFLEDCYREGTYLSTGSSFQDVDFHLELDFEKETVTGYFSASSEVTGTLVPYSHSAEGQITGIIKKVHWGGSMWYWEWEGSASVSLHFLQKHRCLIDGGDYWSSRDETIQVNADLSGVGWSEYDTTSVELNWRDDGGGSQAARSFSVSFSTDQGLEYVPVPYPIDINVKIIAPSEFSSNDLNIVFNVDAKGDDLDLVEEVAWQFLYWNSGTDWWVEQYVKDDLSPLRVTKEMMDDWVWYLNEYGEMVDGEKKLPMTVWLNLYRDNEENHVIEPIEYNFTLSSAQSTRFKLDIVDVIDIYPTGKSETLFEFENSGYKLNKPITFEVEAYNPPFLTFEFSTASETDISEDLVYSNRLTISLDTSKLQGVSLPTEQKIVLKAKSSTSEGPLEDTKEITLNIKPVKWLILHYVSSDTAPPLQEADENNIHEIISAFQETKTHQIGYNLLIDLQNDWTPQNIKDNTKLSKMKTHFLKYYDEKLELIESKNTLDMSKGSTLSDFIKQAKEITPSEKIILILTDHGDGIEGLLKDHHLGIDDATMMSIMDLDKALEGQHVELLILEACLMGKIEVLYEIRDKTDYIISSQLNMKASSFAYNEALNPLLKNPLIETNTIGESFISTYDDNRVCTISFIETSKLDAVVQAVKEFTVEWNKAYTENKVELVRALETIYDFSIGDLRCLVGNIIRNDKITDYKIISTAENIQITIGDAVLAHKSRTDGTLVYFKDGNRGLIIIEDEEATLEIIDETSGENEPEYLGENKYYGVSSENQKNKLSDEYSTKYEKFEFSKNTEWLKLMKNILSSKKDRIEIRKNQEGNNLYLRILDSEGYVNGFDPDSDDKNRIVLDYAQAEYITHLNGTEMLLLPSEAKEFTTHIWGGNMEETEESYTIRYRLIIDDLIVAEQTLENSIIEYTEQSIPITISENEITIGETTITQLEVPIEEPDIETDGQESDQSSDGGIPSFPLASMILGVSVFLLLYRKGL